MIIKLGEYKGFNYKRPNMSVTEEEIERYLKQLRVKSKVEIDRVGEVELGDKLTINYTGSFEGVKIKEFENDNFVFELGGGFFPKEFEECLVGKGVSDCVNISITMPENYGNEEFKNKIIDFKVYIIEAKASIYPPLNDAEVKKLQLNGINTVDELMIYIKSRIKYEKFIFENTNNINQIMDEIVSNTEYKISEEDLKIMQLEIFKDFKAKLIAEGVDLHFYLRYKGITEDQIIEKCKIEAETYLLEKEIIEEIAIKENLKLTKEEQDEAKQGKTKQGKTKQVAMEQLLYQKVVRYLLQENTVA